MDGSTEPARSLLARLFWILVAVWLLLGLVSSFVLVIGLNFIPSTEWAAATHHLRMILGLVSAALLVWAAWKGGKQARRNELNLALSGAACLGYLAGSNVLFIWPILLPLFAGHQVALPYTVLRATDIGVKYCHSPVILADMPFAADGVCHVPESIRTSLSPGSRIVVRGWGTRLGVYARDLSLTD